MAQYDGSIRIITEISTEMAKKSLGTLSNTIVKTAKEISSLRSKMDALKGQKTPTEEYENLKNKLLETLNAIEKLEDKQKKLPKSLSNLSTEQLKSQFTDLDEELKKTIDELEKLDSVKSKMREERLEIETLYPNADLSDFDKEYNDLIKQYEKLQEKNHQTLGQLSSIRDAINFAEEIDKARDSAEQLDEKLSSLEESGKAFTMGEETQEYANLERQLQYEEEALRIATQHYQMAERLNDPYGRLSQALSDLNGKLSSISRMAQIIKQSFSSSDANVSGYERWNSALEELKGTARRVSESVKQSFLDIKENGMSAIVEMTNKMSATLISKLGDALDRTSEKIGEILMKPVALAIKAGAAIKYAFSSAFEVVKEKAAGLAGSAINAIMHPFQTLKSVASTAVSGTANVLKSALAPALEEIKARAAGVAATIINGIAHPFQTMKTIASGAISTTSKLLSGMASIAKKVGSAIKSMVSMLKKAASSISLFGKNTKSSNNMLNSGFKALLKYGLGIRSFYLLVNKFRTAVKEGFSNLSQYSDETNAAISSLKSALTQLKNSLATAFNPILTAIAPALTTFINMVSKAVTYVGMLIAALTGQKTFTKAVAVQEDYAASLKDTSENAKEAAKETNKYLSGLDEVARFEEGNDSSSDSDGGYTAPTPGEMFETVNIPDFVSDWAQRLKEAWEKADFTEIGSLIGTKLKDALDNIPWDKIQATAAKVGKSLATLINGFVEVDGLGYSIGNTIAQAINTGLIGLEAFAKNLHWDSVGKFIADGINGALINIDWNTALSAASLFGTGLADMLNNALTPTVFSNIGYTIGMGLNTALTFANDFLTKFEWHNFGSNIGNGIKVAIETIEWGKLGTTIGNAIQKIIDLFVGFVESKPWEGLGEKIATAINNAVKEIKLSDFTSALSDLVIGLLGELSTAIEKTDWAQVARDIVDAIKAIDWMGIASGLLDVGLQLINALLEAFGELPVPVQIAAAAIGGFLAAFAGASILTTVASVIGGIVTAIGTVVAVLGGPLTAVIAAVIAIGALLIANWDKIKEAAGKLKDWIGEKWEAIKEKTSKVWNNVKEGLSEKWELIKLGASTAFNGIKDKISEKWELVKTGTSTVWNGIKDKLSENWELIKLGASTTFETIRKSVSDKWSEIKTNTDNKWSEIKEKVSSKWDEMKKNAKEGSGNILDKVSEIWGKLKTNTSNTWDEIKKAIKAPINAIIGFINGMIEGIVGGINSLIRLLNNFKIDIPANPFTDAVSIGFNFQELSVPKIPALATGAVIPPNKEFLAILGDQKHGTNIEAPLSTIEEAVASTMLKIMPKFSQNSGNATYNFSAQINRRVLFDEMIEEAKLRQIINGLNPFEMA